MKLPSGIGKVAVLLLIGLVGTGLGLLLIRVAERGRAAAMALSAEILAPLDSAEVGVAHAETASARKPAGTIARRAARPEPAIATDSAAADSAAAAAEVSTLPPLDPDLFPDWTTFDQAVPVARRARRPVLLAFTAYGCDRCEELKREVFEDEAAGVTLRSAVVPVLVAEPYESDGDAAREAGDLQRRFDIVQFPTIVLYFPVSGRVKKLEGYRGRDGTLRWVTETALATR